MTSMQKQAKKYFIFGICFLLLFIGLTAALGFVDVQAIGPDGSTVGFATLNKAVFDFFGGENLIFHTMTDLLGIAAILAAFGFACLGAYQLIKRKKFKLVDGDLYILGAFYIAVISAYLLFEFFIVNRRPILIDGHLEASYPSSHTMVVVSVMITAMLQFRTRIKKRALRLTAEAIALFITAFTIVGRLISGAHWFTDITGGLILSASLIGFYLAGMSLLKGNTETKKQA